MKFKFRSVDRSRIKPHGELREVRLSGFPCTKFNSFTRVMGGKHLIEAISILHANIY